MFEVIRIFDDVEEAIIIEVVEKCNSVLNTNLLTSVFCRLIPNWHIRIGIRMNLVRVSIFEFSRTLLFRMYSECDVGNITFSE